MNFLLFQSISFTCTCEYAWLIIEVHLEECDFLLFASVALIGGITFVMKNTFLKFSSGNSLSDKIKILIHRMPMSKVSPNDVSKQIFDL